MKILFSRMKQSIHAVYKNQNVVHILYVKASLCQVIKPQNYQNIHFTTSKSFDSPLLWKNSKLFYAIHFSPKNGVLEATNACHFQNSQKFYTSQSTNSERKHISLCHRPLCLIEANPNKNNSTYPAAYKDAEHLIIRSIQIVRWSFREYANIFV
ncbi:hypothetical protein K501DRAFT_265510 [Backusella circina FSU 941]|nr:hypothetical protein K501DRAFT_265510 [Backusella circina FSU 941]